MINRESGREQTRKYLQEQLSKIHLPSIMYIIDWSSRHNYDYWNKSFSNASSVDNADIIKTIYDPSVSGFNLPKTAAYTGLTYSGGRETDPARFNVSGSFNKGWNFYTNGWKQGDVFFCYALGFRDIEGLAGAIVNVTISGGVWLAGAVSSAKGRFVSFFSSLVDPQNTNTRSKGFSIRPTLE